MPKPKLLAILLLGLQAASAQQPHADADLWRNEGSAPKDIIVRNGVAIFSADDGIHGRELWRSDGTPEGTQLLADLLPGAASSNPFPVDTSGPLVVVAAMFRGMKNEPNDPNASFRMWVTDGTAAGTVPMTTPNGAAIYMRRQGIQDKVTSFKGATYVATPMTSPLHSLGRLRPDGVVEAVAHIPADAVYYADISHMLGGNEAILIRGAIHHYVDNALPYECIFTYRPGNPVLARFDFNPGDDPRIFGIQDDRLLLRGQLGDRQAGNEPWVSDGTPQGTRLLADIEPGFESSSTTSMTSVEYRGRMYFAWANAALGAELWRTQDPTALSAVLVADIFPGSGPSEPSYLTVAGDRLYFQARTPASGAELWVYDEDGPPRMVADVNPGIASSSPFRFAVAQDRLYFTAEAPLTGGELWVSDGTLQGTRIVRDIVPGPGSSWPYFKAAVGSDLLFTANDGVHGEELWITDGTSEGTRLLKDIRPVLGPNPSSDPQRLTRVGSKLFFVVNDGRYGAELWVSDGTHEGTRLVRDIFPGPAGSHPAEFLPFGDRLLFQADDGVNGVEIWISDGSADGTYLLADLNPGPASAFPHGITRYAPSAVCFAATVEGAGEEFFRLDIGPPVSFNIPLEIRPGSEGSEPANFTAVEWTEGRTHVYFTADDGVHGRELWLYDGVNVMLVSDIVSNRPAVSAHRLAPGDGQLFFAGDDGESGIELYAADPAGVRLVRDIAVEEE